MGSSVTLPSVALRQADCHEAVRLRSLRSVNHTCSTLLLPGDLKQWPNRHSCFSSPGDRLTGLLTESALQSYGYDVLLAGSAAEALDLVLTNRRIRVLVVDADLASGFSLAKAARSTDPSMQVVYTSRAPQKVLEQDKVKGAPCLRAPYRPHQLAGVIGGLLGRRSTEDETAAA